MPENRMDDPGGGGGIRACEGPPVQLELFEHQVGGHSGMLCFDESTLCKPLIPREQKFYETMPKCMRRFTPEYRGTVEVSFHKDSDGYLQFLAHPVSGCRERSKEHCHGNRRANSHSLLDSLVNSGGEEGRSDSDSECSAVRPGSSVKQRFRIQRSGSVEIEGIPPDLSERSDKPPQQQQQVLSRGHKPWSLKCHKQQITRMHQSLKHNHTTHKFILLENLASQFELPSILDLKMGQRQHGDNASEQKRLHQTRKCKNTTSSSLGTRISGMQVYQSDTSHFLCHSKYYGRQLDEKGVGEALRQFLHNGRSLRLDVVAPVIERLTELYDLLKQQDTFRFYSSSLLIMYDGGNASQPYDDNEDEDSLTEDEDLDIPGFPAAHPCCGCGYGGPEVPHHQQTAAKPSTSDCSNAEHCGCRMNRHSSGSRGNCALYGGDVCGGCCASRSSDRCRGNAQCSAQGTSARDEFQRMDQDTDETSSVDDKSSQYDYREKRRRRPMVDVRMIDFAHSTYQGFRGDKTKHDGPDHGYLFGIENLITLFKELLKTQSFNGGK